MPAFSAHPAVPWTLNPMIPLTICKKKRDTTKAEPNNRRKGGTNMKATGILHRACPCEIIGKTEEHWRNFGVLLILSVFRHRKFVVIDSAIPNPRRYIRITFPNICHRISRTAAVTPSGRFYTHILARSLVGSYSLANTDVHEKCQTVSSKLVWQHK